MNGARQTLQERLSPAAKPSLDAILKRLGREEREKTVLPSVLHVNAAQNERVEIKIERIRKTGKMGKMGNTK